MQYAAMVVLGLAIALPSGASALAQDAASYVVSYVEVAPARGDAAAVLLKQLATASRAEAGSLRFDVLRRLGEQNQFAALERWRDAKAQVAHAGGPAATQFHAALTPLLIAPYDERLHVGMAVDARSPPGAGGAALYAVTHVDFIPPKKDEGIAALQAIVAPTRAQSGNLRFDVLQQASRPNHLSVVEIWRDRATFDAHAVSEPQRAFRNTIGPMGGALYDQRFYTALE